VAAALARFGRLDVSVHVAGVSAYGHHTDTTAGVFAQVVTTNLIGAANVARSSLTVFRAQGAGTLVLVGSVLGRVDVPGMGAYVASKWGLRGLVRVLQRVTELAEAITTGRLRLHYPRSPSPPSSPSAGRPWSAGNTPPWSTNSARNGVPGCRRPRPAGPRPEPGLHPVRHGGHRAVLPRP